MRSSGFLLVACLAVLLLVPTLAPATGLYRPGVGVRAGAMGGAFIGLADDYSAVYWNPAGITQIKGMVLTATGQDVVSLASRDGFREFRGEGLEGMEEPPEDYFAWASIAATSDARNLVAPGLFFYTDAGPLRGVVDKVGVAAYTLSEYGSLWNGEEVLGGFIGHPNNYDGIYYATDMPDYESRLKTYVISPIVAKEVFPGLSVGVTADIAYSHLTIKDVFIQAVAFPVDTPEEQDEWWLQLSPIQLADDVTAWGYGATVGALYRVNSKISVGATARSPMTMNYEGDFTVKATGGGETVQYKFPMDFELRYPMWAGVGMAYRDFMFDGLTMTADLQWTDWSTFERIQRNIEWTDEFEGEESSMLETTELNWDDTVSFGLGFDYRVGRTLSVSLGYRTDPSPIQDDDTYNFVMPQTTKNVVGVGVNYHQDFWKASFALQYMAGETMRLTDTYDMDGKHVEDVLIPMLSLTYAF